MGGGLSRTRNYPRKSTGIRSLSSYPTNDAGKETHSPKKRVFISFHIEDESQVELLRQQAKKDQFDIEFIDYSVKEPFDEKWKTQCIERIKPVKVVFCMIGEDTYKREAVLWELKKAYELGKKVVGIRIYRDKNHTIPKPLKENRAKIIKWDLEAISKELNDD